MQAIRQTQLLNKRELEDATPPSASWHADYRDTAWIYVGGLLPELTEGDVCIIFSQYGNPTHLNLIRDRETGKSKGFGFLKYEDQRSCDLAVDNLGGGEVLGRLLRVDHTRYKRKDDEDEETYKIERLEKAQEDEERWRNGNGKRGSDTESEDEGRKTKKRRHLLKEEQELQDMLAIEQAGEDEDPMREYLIREKKEEVERAKAKDREKHEKRKHRHRRENGDEDANHGSDRERQHRHRHRNANPSDHERKKHRDDSEHKSERREHGRDDDRARRRRDEPDSHRTGGIDRDGDRERHYTDSRERRSSRDRERDRRRRRRDDD